MTETTPVHPGRDFPDLRASPYWQALREMTERHDAGARLERPKHEVVLEWCRTSSLWSEEEREQEAIKFCSSMHDLDPIVVAHLVRLLERDLTGPGRFIDWLTWLGLYVNIRGGPRAPDDSPGDSPIHVKLRFLTMVWRLYELSEGSHQQEDGRALLHNTLKNTLAEPIRYPVHFKHGPNGDGAWLGYWDADHRVMAMNYQSGGLEPDFASESTLQTFVHEVNHACRAPYDATNETGLHVWWLDEVYGYTVGWMTTHNGISMNTMKDIVNNTIANAEPYARMKSIPQEWKDAWLGKVQTSGGLVRIGGYERGLDLPLPDMKVKGSKGELDLSKAFETVTPANGWSLKNAFRTS